MVRALLKCLASERAEEIEMKIIALITGVLLFGGLAVADAQTEVPVAGTQHEQVKSSAASKEITMHPLLSIKAADLTRMKIEYGQLQFLKTNRNENHSNSGEPYKSYNPISIPLW
jgi:hypothetical protein